ncbi:thermonuclease family protein [Gammaproteobacteria bacterium]|nr:thermonuclease family protein [Gammaproteobacteria bacterium]
MHIHSVKKLPFLLLLSTLSCYGQDEQIGVVTKVIDGDTIDVELGGKVRRVRYIGVNTPERNEDCYSEASKANSLMIEGKSVRLVKDKSETDRYGRLLRYVYAGDTFVNLELVRQGYAEAVLYQPDSTYYEQFAKIEKDTATKGLGCHATGIFSDGNLYR